MSSHKAASSHNIILIGEGKPPEELFCTLTGGCNRWQFFIAITTFMSEYFHGLNLYCWKFVAPEMMEYHCVNGTKCHYTDGSKCKKFTFEKDFNMETWNERYLLVCDHENYVHWMHFLYRCGLISSYLFVGFLTDKYGRRNIAMTFIPMLGISGILAICSPDFTFLLVAIFCFGLFSAQIHVTPKIALCNAVGNRWRSMALGISLTFIPLAIATLPLLAHVMPSANTIVAVITMVPLLLLIPLLFTKNSPNWSLLKKTVDEAEMSVRKIARFNGREWASCVKICPVNVIDVKQPIYTSIIGLWKASQTRYAISSLLLLWFLHGYMLRIHFHCFAYKVGTPYWPHVLAAVSGPIVSIICIQLNIEHKIIIMVAASASSILLGIYLIIKQYLGVLFLSYFCTWLTLSTIDNLSPRVFPTMVRNMGMGLCFSFCHLGVFAAIYLPFVTWQNFYSALFIFFLIVPALMTIFAKPLWKVHKRELPDVLEDTIKFKTHYKPKRFTLIDSSLAASVVEREVKLVELGEGSSIVTSHQK